MDTGVRSFQLNGTPVASGVVNRLESVMTILWASLLALLTSRKPSAPAPPDLLTTINGCFMRLCLDTIPCTSRAIWSAPPPVPAGTTNSTGLVGSHAAAGEPASAAASSIGPPTAIRRVFISVLLFWLDWSVTGPGRPLALTADAPSSAAPHDQTLTAVNLFRVSPYRTSRVRLLHQQHRYGCQVDHLHGDRSQHEIGHRAHAAGAHEDKVAAVLLGIT